MARYWVIGGEYADISFERLAAGVREERHGPFPSYGDAYAVWQSRARATVDDALVRFRIVEESARQTPAGTTRPTAQRSAP